MSSVTENGDVTAGKPNEEKTYKKVNKTFSVFIVCFSLHVSNSDLLYEYISELTKTKNKRDTFHGVFEIYPVCEVIRYFYLLQS